MSSIFYHDFRHRPIEHLAAPIAALDAAEQDLRVSFGSRHIWPVGPARDIAYGAIRIRLRTVRVARKAMGL